MANILFSYELTLRELDARLLLGYVALKMAIKFTFLI